MKVADVRKELADCSPERREELLSGLVGFIYTFDECGKKEIGHGFDDLIRIGEEWFPGMVTKEAWLNGIENRLEYFNDESEEVVVVLPQPYYIPPVRFELKEIDIPDIRFLEPIEQPKEEPIPYRQKLAKYDKRRNFKPKNFWNRIRSRCK